MIRSSNINDSIAENKLPYTQSNLNTMMWKLVISDILASEFLGRPTYRAIVLRSMINVLK